MTPSRRVSNIKIEHGLRRAHPMQVSRCMLNQHEIIMYVAFQDEHGMDMAKVLATNFRKIWMILMGR